MGLPTWTHAGSYQSLKAHVRERPIPSQTLSFPPAILRHRRPSAALLTRFLFPFALNRCLQPRVCVAFTTSPSSRSQWQGAQKKASDRGHPLGRGRTAVYNGLHVMAYVLPTARTGAEAYPDDPGTSQVSQNLQQLSPKPGKSRFQENAPGAVTLLRGGITLFR